MITLSANDNKRIQKIDSADTYGLSKDLVSKKRRD